MPAHGAIDPLSLRSLRNRTSLKWADTPPHLVAASYAEMDFPAAPAVREVLARMVRNSDFGYPPPSAVAELLEAFAGRAERAFGWAVDEGRICLLNDVMQGVALAIEAFAPPGGNVWTALPAYLPYHQAVGSSGRRLSATMMRPSGGTWRFDLEALRASTPAPSILLLCNPHNPTGVVLEATDLRDIAEYAASVGALVISDEIHMDVVYAPSRHSPFLPIARSVGAQALVLTSAAKGFNLMGLRCAVAVASDERVHRRFQDASAWRAGAPGHLAVAATTAAWRDGDDWLADTVAYLQGNRDALFDAFAQMGFAQPRPQGTYLAWLDLRRLGDEPEEFIARHAAMAVFGGGGAGQPWSGFVRLNYAMPRPILVAALRRLDAAVRGGPDRG